MKGINEKKLYLWRLASFLHQSKMTMSGEELAQHLNRNKFRAGDNRPFKGGRGTYTLIRETWRWVYHELGLPKEARHVARAFVKPNGAYAYK